MHDNEYEMSDGYFGDDECDFAEDCPYCGGTGEQGCDGIVMDCPECGGDGEI
jgi:DnaJ-class molecular chaperone